MPIPTAHPRAIPSGTDNPLPLLVFGFVVVTGACPEGVLIDNIDVVANASVTTMVKKVVSID